MYLANSDNKHPLNEHLIGVAKLAMRAAEHLGLPDDLTELCGVAGMLHDIGKVHSGFQEYIKEGNTNNNFVKHNELSWAFCNNFFKHPGNKLLKKNESFLQAVFWHHATHHNSNKLDEIRSGQILKEAGKSTVKDMYSFVSSLSKESPVDLFNYIETHSKEKDDKVPMPFGDSSTHDNAIYLAIRSCLIFADHHISKTSLEELRNLNQTNDFSKFFTKRTLNSSFESIPNGYDSDRLKEQRNIISECDRVSVVKGPAGFGKTLVGLMWSVKQDGQIYWVVPRNAVAESVYYNIISELEAFESSLSVELYLTGERKESYGNVDEKPCTADIVVTNIDNLLSPMVSERDVGRIFTVNAATIVFDEFHEFINEEAMFGAFITYMKLRNLLAKNTKTLLLSATPSIIHRLWEDEDTELTKILPSNERHYTAQHKKKYNVVFSNRNFEHKEGDSNSLMVMYNSVRNVQDQFCKGNFDYIAHSKFSDEDRKEKLDKIFDIFGKNGTGKGKIVSAPILQASADISVKQLFRVSESPEGDIQTIGRVNRWGREDSASVELSNPNDDSERGAIQERYSKKLSKLWFDFLKTNISQPLSLDELYVIYNKFNKDNKTQVFEYLNNHLTESIKKLYKYYPKKTNKNQDRNISGKTLRNICSSHFIAVKDSETGKWHPFAHQLTKTYLKRFLEKCAKNNKTEKVFGDGKNSSAIQKRFYDQLKKAGFDTDPVLEYIKPKRKNKKKQINRVLLEGNIIEFSRDANCPIPIFNLVYNSEIGLHEREEEKK